MFHSRHWCSSQAIKGTGHKLTTHKRNGQMPPWLGNAVEEEKHVTFFSILQLYSLIAVGLVLYSMECTLEAPEHLPRRRPLCQLPLLVAPGLCHFIDETLRLKLLFRVQSRWWGINLGLKENLCKKLLYFGIFIILDEANMQNDFDAILCLDWFFYLRLWHCVMTHWAKITENTAHKNKWK